MILMRFKRYPIETNGGMASLSYLGGVVVNINNVLGRKSGSSWPCFLVHVRWSADLLIKANAWHVRMSLLHKLQPEIAALRDHFLPSSSIRLCDNMSLRKSCSLGLCKQGSGDGAAFLRSST